MMIGSIPYPSNLMEINVGLGWAIVGLVTHREQYTCGIQYVAEGPKGKADKYGGQDRCLREK